MQPQRLNGVAATSTVSGYPAATAVVRPVQVQAPATPAAPSSTSQPALRPASAVAATNYRPAATTAVLRPAASTSVSRVVAAPAASTAVAASPPATSTTAYSVPATSQAMPVVYTRVPGSGAVLQPTVVTQAAPMRVETRPNTLAGPGYTQGAYEQKHQDDPQLQNLKELRRTCGLKGVPVGDGLMVLKNAATEGKLTREQFVGVYGELVEAHGVERPPESVQNAVFDLFDRNDDNVVDMMELICGISLLCSGSEDDKIHAVFNVFDENGDGFISMDEMFKFLTSVFKVVLTPNVMGVMNSMGVTVESPEDLASVTTMECFKMADLNHDGKLSTAEFKSWFYAPRNDPSFLFSPVRKLLQ